jgi:hypothetical protein
VATYLPTTSLSPLYTFVQFSGTVSAFQTALNSAFPGLGIQCFADTTSGQTSWAVVVIGDVTVFAVPPNNWVGYNLGSWSQYVPAKMAGGASSLFTVYP